SLQGGVSVVPGYAGGHVPNPTYEQVCSGATGHAEATKVEFDPRQIGFADLLNVFFATHDPTSLNRQGNDVGEQYRSAIFYTAPEQETSAREFLRAAQAEFDRPIVTQVEPLVNFYPAEDYHRNYYLTHPDQAYCQLVIDPKLAKFRAKFSGLLK
ncbi:MAG TPA: peptide-methionine (S)-S-oxide reductase MsrA, partial [Patescibacteria group bacterium]|nr:peptide-methionine (S)-S-oxide reductase MsrA [Patescibacteria group bacterium]